MQKVLLVGHRGMLGTDLVKLLGSQDGVELHEADLPEFDLTDRAAVGGVVEETQPDVVVNCAAWTDVDGAQSHADEAFRVNARGAGDLAAAAETHGARMVHVSTDFVFDGTKSGPYVETDEPNPINVYGESKLASERMVTEACRAALIVRTAWLYGLNGRSFVTTILKHAREKDELRVVDDQYGSPTWTANLSCAMWALIRANAHGIVHAAGSGACTWCDFAREIVSLAGLETRVTAITSDELERPARRPANSTLDTTKLRGLTGFSFPDWRDSLKTFMGEMNEQGPTTSF